MFGTGVGSWAVQSCVCVCVSSFFGIHLHCRDAVLTLVARAGIRFRMHSDSLGIFVTGIYIYNIELILTIAA